MPSQLADLSTAAHHRQPSPRVLPQLPRGLLVSREGRWRNSMLLKVRLSRAPEDYAIDDAEYYCSGAQPLCSIRCTMDVLPMFFHSGAFGFNRDLRSLGGCNAGFGEEARS